MAKRGATDAIADMQKKPRQGDESLLRVISEAGKRKQTPKEYASLIKTKNEVVEKVIAAVNDAPDFPFKVSTLHGGRMHAGSYAKHLDTGKFDFDVLILLEPRDGSAEPVTFDSKDYCGTVSLKGVPLPPLLTLRDFDRIVKKALGTSGKKFEFEKVVDGPASSFRREGFEMDLLPALLIKVSKKEYGDALVVPQVLADGKEVWKRSFSSFDELDRVKKLKIDGDPNNRDWLNFIRLLKTVRDKLFRNVSSYALQELVIHVKGRKESPPTWNDFFKILDKLRDEKTQLLDPFFKEELLNLAKSDFKKIEQFKDQLAASSAPDQLLRNLVQ
eukprot:TRINITY_DN4648_c0_g2_i1.p1 TRINITY_DN4648_c0_g2~~TRINITY_DN4648_c0_g2_i1.p1  ORF type:complete len:350 (-),score=61.66 TRINITY_DN4648_c0_g2_i1:227-1216(-)